MDTKWMLFLWEILEEISQVPPERPTWFYYSDELDWQFGSEKQ